MNFKKSATIIKLNAAVTNLNVRGILMPHWGRDTSSMELVAISKPR
jgi:hypothetical protein